MKRSYELDIQANELRTDARRLLGQIVRRCKTISELDVSSAKWRSLVTNAAAVELATLLLTLVDKKQRFLHAKRESRIQWRREQRESDKP